MITGVSPFMFGDNADTVSVVEWRSRTVVPAMPTGWFSTTSRHCPQRDPEQLGSPV